MKIQSETSGNDSTQAPGNEVPELLAKKLKGKHAAVVTFSSYPHDARPRYELEVLKEMGMRVDILCIPSEEASQRREVMDGVNVLRIPVKHQRGGKLGYLAQYATFFTAVFFTLTFRSFSKKYALVHIHNMPDFLVFAALVPKMMGAKVILDLHDPMPELMKTIFGITETHPIMRVVEMFEKWSTKYADVVITVNKTCRDLFAARSCPAGKIRVIMNLPDEKLFAERNPVAPQKNRKEEARPFVMMYHGSLVERHGLDLAILALKKIRAEIPGAVLNVYGEPTPFFEGAMRLARDLGLEESVRHYGQLSLEQVAGEIAKCDVGVIPNRESTFTKINTPTRIFEYISQGKPVIAPRAAGILECFSDRELILFELGNAEDLALKMAYVFKHPEEMACMAEHARQLYQRYKWSRQREELQRVVLGLVAGLVW